MHISPPARDLQGFFEVISQSRKQIRESQLEHALNHVMGQVRAGKAGWESRSRAGKEGTTTVGDWQPIERDPNGRGKMPSLDSTNVPGSSRNPCGLRKSRRYLDRSGEGKAAGCESVQFSLLLAGGACGMHAICVQRLSIHRIHAFAQLCIAVLRRAATFIQAVVCRQNYNICECGFALVKSNPGLLLAKQPLLRTVIRPK